MVAGDVRAHRGEQILQVTRALLDERGDRDALIGEIAKAVGVNRAIIYRHFSSKEELFAMTLVGYLQELEQDLVSADDPAADPLVRLGNMSDAFLNFGRRYPAFVDCAQTLLRFRGDELMAAVREDRLIELGAAMNHCMQHPITIIEVGNATGDFRVEDPSLFINVIYTQALGLLNLMAFHMSVHELDTGLPAMQHLDTERVYHLARKALVSIARPD